MGALVFVGVDLGQKRDPTAIVVTEFVEETDPPVWWQPNPPPRRTYYAVRYIQRLPLGSSYVEVADRIAEIVRKILEQDPRASVRVVMDATGVGRPVVDLMKDRVKEALITGATITAGDGVERGYNEARVGKAYLVSRLQVLLQTDRLKLPKTPEALALAEELLNFEIRVDPNGQDHYGAFRVGTHDDLVIALGLAVLYGEGSGPRQVQYIRDFWE